MRVLILLALLGLATSAPQNWPYRDSLMPYRYGYPNTGSASQYKYLPTVEDDEDIGPYPAVGVGRQDFVVGSDGDYVRPTTDSPVVGVIETGSVAPVVEPPKATPSPPPPRPVGPEQSVGKPVQPPPFPPARPLPTPRPKDEEEEEDEDEDDDESDEADDEHAEDEDTDDTPEPEDHDDREDGDEEEERRRQEPLSEEKPEEPVIKSEVVPKPVDPAPVPVPVPSVVAVVDSVETEPVAPPSSVEDVKRNPVPEKENEVPTKPTESEDESDEDTAGLDDSIEALVPGYVTDQGEVLVPVDTVTGDQPISIVPDPYSPPTRGVPIDGTSHFRYNSFSDPFYYSDIYDRQESDEESAEAEARADQNVVNTVSNTERRNEFLTSFPPSRTPALFAVINSRFPTTSQESDSYETSSSNEFFGPVIAYRVKQTQQRPSVSVAVALSGTPTTQSHSSSQQYVRNPFFPTYSQQIRNQGFSNFHVPIPVPLRRPSYSPYNRPAPSPYGIVFGLPRRQPNPYGHPYGPVMNPYLNRFVQRPVFNPYHYDGPYRPAPQGYRPSPFYTEGPVRRPVYSGPSPFGGFGSPRPPIFNGYGTTKPVLLNRRPGYNKQKPASHTVSANKVVYVKNKPVRKPTPVVHQDDIPYTFEDPQGYGVDSNESNQSDVVQPFRVDPQVVKSSRRGAKMAKKVIKKEKAAVDKPKKRTDPLRILKKISAKRA